MTFLKINKGGTKGPAKLGKRLEQGTFTVIIDEGEGLFLKSDGTSTTDRSTVKRGSE